MIKSWEIVAWGVWTFDSPVIFGLSITVHVYKVFGGIVPVGTTLNEVLLQIETGLADSIGLE